MKLCKDCKWVADPGKFAKCNAPQNMKNVPTGFVSERRWDYCSVHRDSGVVLSVLFRMCGRSGRWFEVKEGGGE